MKITPTKIFWPDGLPESDAVIAQLRRRIHRDGICAEDFRLLAERGGAAFQKM